MVAAVGGDGQGADDLSGGGVDDADVVAIDEQDDAGSVEGSPEADVVEEAVDAQGDCAGRNKLGADTVKNVRLSHQDLRPFHCAASRWTVRVGLQR